MLLNSILIFALLFCVYKNHSKQFSFHTLLFFYDNLKYVGWYSASVLMIGVFLKFNNAKIKWGVIITSIGLGLLVIVSYSIFNPW